MPVYNVRGPAPTVSEFVKVFNKAILNGLVKLNVIPWHHRSINVLVADEREDEIIGWCQENGLTTYNVTIDISKIHTKALLAILRSAQMETAYGLCEQTPDPEKWGDAADVSPRYFSLPGDIKLSPPVTVGDIRLELNSREHVPNKVESREIRKKKAHVQKNR